MSSVIVALGFQTGAERVGQLVGVAGPAGADQMPVLNDETFAR